MIGSTEVIDSNASDKNKIEDIQETIKKLESEVESKDLELKNDITLKKYILNSLSNGILSYTMPERKILVLNGEAKRIFGLPDDFDGDFDDFMTNTITPPNIDAINEAIEKLKKPGDSVLYKISIPHGKTKIIAEAITKLLEFENGEKFILSTIQDITENEHLSKMLYEERQQYRDALIKNSEYFFSFDVTEGHLRDDIILPDGTGMLASLGLTIPASYDDFCELSLKKNKIRLISKGIENMLTCKGIIETFNKGITNLTVEHYMENRDEYIRSVMLFTQKKETGHVHAFVVATNITEECKRANEAEKLTRQQQEISNSFSTLFFATWLIDLNEGTIKPLNIPNAGFKVTEQKRIFSYKKAVENFINNFVAKEYRNEVKAFLSEKTIPYRIETRNMLSCEYIYHDKEWRRMHLIPLSTEKGYDIKRLILAIQDITQEKLKDNMARQAMLDAYNSATRANKSKTEFLSRMSHDIRTPINAIVGMTAIADMHLDDKERVHDCLSKITVASNHLLGLVNDVLDMSKIESGRIDLQVGPFTIDELIDTLITISKPQIESKNHQLTVNADDIKHRNVVGDLQRLQQAFMNLISNAVKYTPDGGKISISLCEKPTNKEKVGCYEFCISDNGIGMSEDYLKHLYEPFWRAEDERVAKIQGTGLGMSITRNIVQMMNGNIEVESQLNKGTKITVTLFLELYDAKNNNQAEMKSTLPDEKKDFSLNDFNDERFAGKRVLLTEDNEINMEIAVEILNMAKLQVETASNGKEALEKVSASPDGYYDMIFMDIQMPVMTGLDSAKAIRALGREYTNKVPIIAMTANAFSDDVIASKNSGMNEHLAKPLKFETLLTVMKKWL